jgi:hypothetical protein
MGLTLEQYETFGRLQGAEQRKADAVLTQTLPAPSAEEIAALQQAFVEHLIRLTTDGKEAKQPARRSLLPTASLRLVDRFSDGRLLVAGKDGAAGATNLWLMLTLRSCRPHACSVRMPP